MAFNIRIGSVDFAVTEVEELASSSGMLYGDIDYQKCRIRICKEANPQMKHITLWHEILHGVLANAGKQDHDEELIDLLAYGIVGVLRDNPHLFRA